MNQEKMMHINFKRDWINYFADDTGQPIKLPDRFIAKDKEGRNLIITTYTYLGGTMGHGMGREEGFKFIATRITPEGDLVDEDSRIRKEGFWIRDLRISEVKGTL